MGVTNFTEASDSPGKTLQQIFGEQVERWGDAVALVSQSVWNKSKKGILTLTYNELNRRSDGVAARLVEKGVSPGDIVAIMLDRSAEMVVGVFGILKAGAAYLPIDPDFPPERIAYILKDSGAKLLAVANDKESEQVRRWEGEKIFLESISHDSNHIKGRPRRGHQPSAFDITRLQHSNLAYVIYTSGSTGTPKGVAVEHRSVVNIINGLSTAYPLTPGDGYLLKTSLLFDVSVSELFGWFMGGGRLIVLEKGGEKDPHAIIDTIEMLGVTHINFVPAMFSTFTDFLEPQNMTKIAGLKYIFLAGEALAPELVNRFRRLNTTIRLENLYGPTEATVYASGYSLSEWTGTGSIPIGKALPGVMLFILDKEGHEVTAGETGELCIGGAGVARGYLNNPPLTAEQFVDFHPANSCSPSHFYLYRTGDLARQSADGNIEFLGRLDHQVKIHGFRIELGEVENRLFMYPGVKDAVVVAKESATGDRYLCAYIIVKHEEGKLTVTAEELKEHLSRQVPAYMVPPFFVFLDRLPLTNSGKVDRKALPDPEIRSPKPYIAPRDFLEEKLAILWAEILGMDKHRIGIADNFFELGGRSLKGAGLIQRIHKTFNARLQLSELFKMPTIRDLASYIKTASKDRYLGLEKAPVKDYYPLSAPQRRLYVLYRLNPDSTVYNIPAVFSLAGVPDHDRLTQAFRKLISRHESLRTSFRMMGQKPVQVIHDNREFEIETLTNNKEDKTPPSPFDITPYIRPFDLSRAPLMRVILVKNKNETGSDGCLLILDVHHIVADGLSLDILMAELPRVYDGQELPPLRFQYKDYSERQRLEQEEETQSYKDQRNYWLTEYSRQKGEIPLLSLPLDYTRPAVQGFEGNTIYARLDDGERAGVLSLVKTGNTTLYMLLLAIFNILLSKLSGQEDIITGTPLAGRNYVELRPVVGMFVKTLALRNFPTGTKPFNEFLKEVKERTLAAFDNQDYPFEELVEAVVTQREVNRNPLFDCLFGLETSETAEYGGDGLRMKPLQYQSRTAKFDLTLTIEESEGDLTLRLEYDTTLFKQETGERLLGYYREILRAVQAGPGQRISEITIISEAEKRKITAEFNNTGADYPRDKTIHRLFEDQAVKSPDHIAVITPANLQISYRQLNERADRTAAGLMGNGLPVPAPFGTIMAIMVERSLEMIVGILAILKAGGAYLPIEPREPGERKRYMLADSDAKILMTTRELSEKDEAVNKWAGNKIFLEEVPPSLTGVFPFRSSAAGAADAYIIYTSGSTGVPKGVIVGHRATVNLLLALFRTYPIEPSGGYLLKTAFIFDVSVSELFGWFMGGSRVIVMAKRGENDPQAMGDAIAKHHVTHINFAPAMFNIFISKLDARGVKQITGLNYIFLAGEALPPELVLRFRQFNTAIRLENLYGPTEGTVYASGYSLSHWGGGMDIPIGKPLANVQLYILDHQGRHKAIGEIGELIITGEGLAKGYLNNPELTAVKFKFNKSTGSYGTPIFYHTGDLARWLPDGNIQFLGRIDHQVKIRGFRIELGDVENQLLKHPHIKEAVVIPREEENQDKYLCAYFVSDQELSVSGLRDFLSEKLSAFVIPQYFVPMEKLPLTPSGKIDRKQLPAPDRSRPKLDAAYIPPRTELEKIIGGAWKEVLKLENIGIHDRFFDLGGNSLKFIQVNHHLAPYLGKDKEIPAIIMFQYPTIHALAQYLSGTSLEPGTGTREPLPVPGNGVPVKSMAIAVIGMAGRFPGAQNINEFWENLKNGVESIAFFSEAELLEAGVETELLADPNYIGACGFLEGNGYFDAEFFRYTPREAEMMDPQLRVYHECAWTALEDAGYDPGTYNGSIGNYAGAQFNLNWMTYVMEGGGSPSERFDANVLNSNYSFSSRISYNFNLRGPSITLQTACSTSLVAIHLACRGLVDHECDMALAGGIKIAVTEKWGYLYQEGMILSPDGHCRAFDAAANGTVDGDGGGIVVLKRLSDALDDGDYIYAVIKGSATNNDGVRKAGYTVPSIEGQADVIRAAQKIAGVEPESITYVETHGTGTNMGDPIEVAGLKLAFNTGKRKFCAIGSVKTNVGHLDNGAGVTGFIKTVLALHYKWIPPSLHFERPNPKIDFANSPFYVNNRLKEWKREIYPLRAGVSSFGVGGTNAHVVLEEWPETKIESRETGEMGPIGIKKHQLILLSARNPKALEKISTNLAHYLQRAACDFENVGYTLQVGRRHFRHKRMLVCADAHEAIKILEAGSARTFFSKIEGRTIVFMFSGQGNQYVNMGLDLYRREPIFKEELDRCFALLNERHGLNIKEILYPDEGNEAQAAEKIPQLIYSAPIKFSFEYAMAKLLTRWGIHPDAMIGHSFGEYAAACTAGVFSLEEGLDLSVWRSRLMDQLPAGAMLSVSLPEDKLRPLLGEDISVAAVNAPSLCYVSGTLAAIEKFEKHLQEAGHEYIRLKVPVAGHSPMMDTIAEQYRREVARVTLKPPVIPYISGLTGRWISALDTMDPDYWIKHLRHAVRFLDGLTELFKEPNALFVQLGPGKGLTMFVEQNPNSKPQNQTVNLVRHYKENIPDSVYLLNRIGDMWLYGIQINWPDYYQGQKRQRVPLPTYPFEGRDYSLNAKAAHKSAVAASRTVSLGRKPDIGDWFYVPSWQRWELPAPPTHKTTPTAWLVFTDDRGLGNRLVKTLEQKGNPVVRVEKGARFFKASKLSYKIDPQNPHDYHLLINELIADGNIPVKIVHLWCVTGTPKDAAVKPLPLLETVAAELDNGFYSLFNLVRAIGNSSISAKLEMEVVTDQVFEVTGTEIINPGKSTVLGPVRVIPKEYFNIQCRCIDIEMPGPQASVDIAVGQTVDQLVKEFATPIIEPVVAYRGRFRWIPAVSAVSLPQPDGPLSRLRQKGVYLITGGLGGIGLTLAGYLARTVNAGLILTGRLAFPPREEWAEWLAGHEKDNKISRLIEKVQELEKWGGNVLVIPADVTDIMQMRAVVARGMAHFGHIHGVIHSAGAVDGRVIQLRTKEMLQAILAPKIKGTLVLDSVLKHIDLDFFILCSSLNSVAGTIGQVAYTAANNFLDSFAGSRMSTNSRFTLSVNWDTWQEVGMAVEAAVHFGKRKEFAGYPVAELTHPIFDYCYLNGTRQVIYISHLKVSGSWFLDEHRIMGNATIPGTAYLEMIVAAAENYTGNRRIEINDMYFLTPLVVGDAEEKEVHTLLEKKGDGFVFSVKSRLERGQDKWLEHVKGAFVFLKKNETPPPYDIGAIRAQLMGGTEILHQPGDDDSAQSKLVKTGPRWRNIKHEFFTAEQGWTCIELPGAYLSDLASFKLHPALLDTATAFLLGKTAGETGNAYVPFSIKKVQVHGDIPRTLFSQAVYWAGEGPALNKQENRQENKQGLDFDITVMDEKGNGLLHFQQFTFLKVSPGNITGNEKKIVTGFPGVEGNKDIPGDFKSVQPEHLKDAIRPGEGVEVFKRLLAAELTMPQVLVSTRDLPSRLEQNKYILSPYTQEEPPAESDYVNAVNAGNPRPELSAPYTPPGNHTEQKLAGIWQEFFGIRDIGIEDDFFELGGDSLKALTIISKIRKELKADVSMTDFFAVANISGLAEIIKNSGKSIYSSIASVEEKEYYPLSSAQLRLYLHQMMQQANLLYNINFVQIIEGPLALDRLENAFKVLVQRHESLRTSFIIVADQPMQKINKNVDFKIAYRKIEPVDVKVAEITRNFIRPFDLAHAPLMRTAVIEMGKERYAWIIDIHHIITDATGCAVLQKELLKLYNNEKLSPLKLQYRDFSEWQNHLIQGGGFKQKEDYWLKVFANGSDIPVLNMPTDFPRPGQRLFTGSFHFFELGAEETRKFKELGSAAGATLFAGLMTVLDVLLFKYTGQDDIIIGSTTAGRPHSDLLGIVGMFVNTLAIRNFPQPGKTYFQLLKEVKPASLNAFENQDMQFEILVERLNLETNASRNPLFDVCLNVQTYEQPEFEVKNLEITPYFYESEMSKFDMLLWANPVRDELHFMLEYSTELFKPTTAAAFSNHFLEIIRQVIINKDIKLKDIGISHRVVTPDVHMPQIDFEF